MKQQSTLRPFFGRFDTGSEPAFYGKWLWFYFWMNFVGIIPSLLMNSGSSAAMMSAVGGILNTLLALVSACILLILGMRESRFRKSGMLYVVITLVGYFVSVMNQDLVTGVWSTVGSLLELAAEYYFFTGCAAILDAYDLELSLKWTRLWKWYLIVHVVSIVGLAAAGVLLGTSDTMLVMLSAVTTLILAVAVLVVAILELFYQYRTAQTFRKH